MKELKDKHTGQTAWIVGKGPSLHYLTEEDIGEGIVIALHEAIGKVNELNIPNVVYSMQKDGGRWKKYSPSELMPDCDYIGDCDKCPGMVRPRDGVILLLHEMESKYCFPDFSPRIIFTWQELGLPHNSFSLNCAVPLAKYMGCDKVVLMCCDAHVNGDLREYVPGVGAKKNQDLFYKAQAELIKPALANIKSEYAMPRGFQA